MIHEFLKFFLLPIHVKLGAEVYLLQCKQSGDKPFTKRLTSNETNPLWEFFVPVMFTAEANFFKLEQINTT
jgi:hypothetical protein